VDVGVGVGVVVEGNEAEVPNLRVDCQRQRDQSDVDQELRTERESGLLGRARWRCGGLPLRFSIPDWNVSFLNLVRECQRIDRAEARLKCELRANPPRF
jgi:hypothetical protein